jgi:hypothetical protein
MVSQRMRESLQTGVRLYWDNVPSEVASPAFALMVSQRMRESLQTGVRPVGVHLTDVGVCSPTGQVNVRDAISTEVTRRQPSTGPLYNI